MGNLGLETYANLTQRFYLFAEAQLLQVHMAIAAAQ